jgi:hypothetical protein
MKRLLSALVWMLLVAPELSAEAPSHPNVIVIVADDFGWGSLGCYGQASTGLPAKVDGSPMRMRPAPSVLPRATLC